MRLIRSKGVGVFFVTQCPTDVPDDVLAQLGSRVQHQLRAHTPNDAKALKATVNTYPKSAYDDLGEVITIARHRRGRRDRDERARRADPRRLDPAAGPRVADGAWPTRPRWRRRSRARRCWATYSQVVDRESAREKLAARLEEGARKAEEDAHAKEEARQAKVERTRSRPPPPSRRTTTAW